MEGILRSSRYAFGPNRLHYCGPDKNAELRDRINHSDSDRGLETILKEFKTLYPYLQLIAGANEIADPFDTRVVEAYWLGNELLERVSKRQLYGLLMEGFGAKDKAGAREFSWLEKKIGEGAVPHHSFHVLNVWRQTSGEKVAGELESLSECCINAGKVLAVKGPEIEVLAEVPVYVDGKFIMSAPQKKVLTRRLEAEYDIEQLVPGKWVSFHWGMPCEELSLAQVANLRKYTLQNIAFANQTI